MDIITISLGNYKELEVYPLADLHLGDTKTDEKMFEGFLSHIMDKPNRYLTVCGDMVNNAIMNSKSNTYNEKYPPDEQKYKVADYLKQVKDRILCMVPGNHEERTTRTVDVHIIKDIAHDIGRLDRYRENGAYINIQFGKDRHGHKLSYAGYILHGKGGGKKAGAALAMMQQMSMVCIADFYIAGHLHQREGKVDAIGKPNAIWTVIEYSPRGYMTACPWQDYGGYAQRGIFTPQVKGAKPMILSGKYKNIEIRL